MENFKTALMAIKKDYLQVVAENGFDHLNFDVEVNIALRLVENSFFDAIPLTKASPQSVAHSVFSAGAMGISLSPGNDHAIMSGDIGLSGNIIAKLHLTYKGLLFLCYEAGAISHVSLWVIRKNDKVKLSNDLNSKPQIHIEDLFGDRGDVVGALCSLCTPRGDYLNTLMTAAELEQVATFSRNHAGWNGVFADEFRKKQVLKRALHTMASAYHGRVANAAKYLTDESLDLYEQTERISMTDKPRHKGVEQQQVSSHQSQTRGEAAFRKQPTKIKRENKMDTYRNVQTKGLYIQ